MGVRHFFKKMLRTLSHEHLIIYALLITILSVFVAQRSYSQEKNESVETSDAVQQKGTTFSYTPVLDKDGNIYIASCDGKLSAIDQNGDTKWYIQLADKINFGIIISPDDTLYFSSEETLYAISSNGVLKWIFNAENTIDPPSVLGNQGNIYIVTKKDDFLYAISPSGSMHWKVHINGDISSPPSVTADGSIYITTQDNMLYAINADGLLRWRRKIFSKKEEALSLTKTASSVVSDSLSQSKIKPIFEEQEQTTSQALKSSHVISEEAPSFSKENNKPLTTSFIASTQKGTVPLTVKFSDTSTGKIINRLWDFGDGSLISSEQYPVHTYSKPGNYNIRLIIKRTDCISTLIKQDYITVTKTSAANNREIMTDIQRKNNNTMPTLPLILNKYNDTNLSNNETILSIANAKN